MNFQKGLLEIKCPFSKQDVLPETALASDGACPPSRCRATFPSLSPNVFKYTSRVGEDTVTCSSIHVHVCSQDRIVCVGADW